MILWLLDLLFLYFVFFFKQKTAYEMRISDWSSDVCSSDLRSLYQNRRVEGDYQGDARRARGKDARPSDHRGARRGHASRFRADLSRQGGSCLRADRKSTRLKSSH